MTPETMRELAANWAGRDLRMRDHWLMAAEVAERLDAILAAAAEAVKSDSR